MQTVRNFLAREGPPHQERARDKKQRTVAIQLILKPLCIQCIDIVCRYAPLLFISASRLGRRPKRLKEAEQATQYQYNQQQQQRLKEGIRMNGGSLPFPNQHDLCMFELQVLLYF